MDGLSTASSRFKLDPHHTDNSHQHLYTGAGTCSINRDVKQLEDVAWFYQADFTNTVSAAYPYWESRTQLEVRSNLPLLH
ncbi:MAG: hypothetical protein AB8B50_09275 [Pirellulaceae bacterium]